MTGQLTERLIRAFDALERAWTSDRARAWLSRFLLVAFVGSIAWIEFARLGIAEDVLGRPMPTNHLAAISWIVTLLLFAETLDLVFGLAASMSRALAKQLQIFSLVLLRKSLDELPNLGEPVDVAEHLPVVLRMASDATGALLVFASTVLYTKLIRHEPISDVADDVERFIRTKKLICLALLVAFAVIAAVTGFESLTFDASEADPTLDLAFFEVFFTALIFADVAIVLASLGATKVHRVIFRNFAFATVTVFLRLALSAPPFYNSALGVGASLFAIGTVWLSGRAAQKPREGTADEPGPPA